MLSPRRIGKFLPASLRRFLSQRLRAFGVKPAAKTTVEIVNSAIPNLRVLPLARAEGSPPYVTMVTDSILPKHLFGGVGTAAILAATIATEQKLRLRIVTREFEPVETPIRNLLVAQGVKFDGPIELMHSSSATGEPTLPVGSHDVLLTTSWWTTSAVLNQGYERQILYLLQEDERMFYEGGDRRLRCEEILNNKDIKYAVNTNMLLKHFIADRLRGPTLNGVSFEPAFVPSLYFPEHHTGRKRFLFYARPNHPRNLYLRGLEALDAALQKGLLPEDEWEIHFIGVDVPEVNIGRKVFYHDTLSLAEYAALVRVTDLGLSLMYTPHPSYPPLDLAASGAVVVTNQFGSKTSLGKMCGNILCVPLSVEDLVAAIGDGARLVADTELRSRNLAQSQIATDWTKSFQPIMRQIANSRGQYP